MNNNDSPIVPPKKLPATKAWKMTSLLVRLKAKGRCYTCGARVPLKKLHAGHFNEKLGNAAIYFELKGLRGQCYRCNRLLHGNKAIYAAKLIEESGPEIITEMNRMCLKSKVWRKDELDKIAAEREKEIKKPT